MYKEAPAFDLATLTYNASAYPCMKMKKGTQTGFRPGPMRETLLQYKEASVRILPWPREIETLLR